MATDTRTPVLGLLKQGTGNSNNTWGELLNTQVIDLIEKAIAGYALVVVTGASDVTLDDDEYICPVIELTGTLAADQTIIFPDLTRRWTVINNTTGDFFVLVKVSGGAAVNAPSGCSTDIFCDGAGTLKRHDAERVGNIFYHGGTTAPAGALECTGASVKRASAVDLYGEIGTTFGTSDSTDFKLPNGYDTARYLRSRSASLTVGTSQSSQNKSHSHTGSGTTNTESVGHTHGGSGTTGNQSASHTHSGVIIGGAYGAFNGGENFTVVVGLTGGSSNAQSSGHTHSYSFTTDQQSALHTHSYSFTTSSDGGTEARPESLVAMMCIWY